jgi:hypothetical protein
MRRRDMPHSDRHGPRPFAVFSLLAAALAALLVTAADARAQTAGVVGAVTDSSRGVIPGATITLTNKATNDMRVATSNDQGQYTIPFLPSGRYTVKCELTGFQSVLREDVVLETDQEVRVDFQLSAGSVTEDVLVVGTPLLASDTSSVGQVVTGKTISDLPLNGRNFLQLARLATGVVESAAGDRARDGGAFVANGARSVLNSFMLDGVDNNARIVDQQNSSNVVSQPSVDALAEFSIQTNNFSAEYGQAAGAVVNATIKSGTNDIRGILFEFLRNDAFDARDPFAPPAQGKELNRHQFGGTIGGPVLKDRTFFFASVERTDEERGQNYRVRIPTAEERNGDFSSFRNAAGALIPIYDPATTRPNPNGTGVIRDAFPGNRIPVNRLHSLSKSLLDMLPAPNVADPTANYAVTRNATRNRTQLDTRVDHSFSNNSKLYVRYSLTDRDDEIPGPFDAPLIGTSSFQDARKAQNAHSFAIGQTQVLGGTKVNELRIGYNRIGDDLFPFVTDKTPADFGFRGIPQVDGVTGMPQINITGWAGLGEATFLPNFKISEVAQVGDTFSFLRGRHAFKAGVNYRSIRSYFAISDASRGSFTFNGGFTQNPLARSNTGTGMADFLLGIPNTGTLSTVLSGDLRYHYVAGFLQDDWRVNDRLTLNLGIRYELFTQPSEKSGRQGNLLLDQGKLIYANDDVPVGIPDTFTTPVPDGISASSLMRLDTNNVAPRLGAAYKLSERTVLRGGAGLFYGDHPTVGASGRLPANPPFRVNVSYPTDLVTPILTLDSGFPSNALDPVFSPFLTMNAWNPDAPQAEFYHWNTTVQHELPWAVVEVGYTGSHGESLSVQTDPNSPRPGAGAVAARRPNPNFGAMTGIDYNGKSDYHAGHLRVERRFRDGFSLIGHYTYAKSIDLGGTTFVTNDLVYRNPLDIEMDRGLSSFDIRHNLVLSYIWDLPIGAGRRVDLKSAFLNGIVGGWQFNGVTTARSGNPFTPSLSVNPTNAGHARPDRLNDGNLARGDRSADRWFDPSAFAAPAAFNYGTAGRNVLFGPGLFNTDFGLFKRVLFDGWGSQKEIQIRLEAFNVFNQAHYGNPEARVDLATAGQIRAITGTMREMQIGIKFLF